MLPFSSIIEQRVFVRNAFLIFYEKIVAARFLWYLVQKGGYYELLRSAFAYFLSFDSEERFENYLAFQPEFLWRLTTLISRTLIQIIAMIFPIMNSFNNAIRLLQEQTATKLLKGIEIGVVPGQETQIRDYLDQHPYDLKLVSIHQNGSFDYMDDAVLEKDKLTVVKSYFDQMATVLDTFSDGHILTHFDYGLRRFDFTAEELAQHFEKELTVIFKKVVARELAFEVNAKSFWFLSKCITLRICDPTLSKCGGKLFTLGSDAHKSSDYRLLFAEMSQMLRSFGVEQLAVFQGTERYMADLPEG